MHKQKQKNHKIGSGRRHESSTLNIGKTKALTVSKAPNKVTGASDIQLVKLRYSSTLVDFTASIGYYAHVFRLNSLFDPDYTGVGAQPLGFDQWAALYGSYRVIRASAKLTAAASVSQAIPMVMGFYPSTDATTESIIDNAMQKPRSSYQVVSWVGTNKNTVKRSYPLHAILGLTAEQYRTQPETAATVSANPGTPVYLTLFAFNLNGTWSASASSNPTLVFELEFEVEFFLRQNIDESFRLLREIKLTFPDCSLETIKEAMELRRKLVDFPSLSGETSLPAKKH